MAATTKLPSQVRMSGSDCKPVVTWAGDATVFSSLEAGLKSGLPNEAVEWKRSYGRQSRQVYIEAEFVPFSAETVVGGGEVGLQGQPVFHTFWTAVVDTEQYRTNVKEEVAGWLVRYQLMESVLLYALCCAGAAAAGWGAGLAAGSGGDSGHQKGQ